MLSSGKHTHIVSCTTDISKNELTVAAFLSIYTLQVLKSSSHTLLYKKVQFLVYYGLWEGITHSCIYLCTPLLLYHLPIIIVSMTTRHCKPVDVVGEIANKILLSSLYYEEVIITH